MTDHKLSEGLTLHFIENDKFKSNYFSLQFSAPITREEASLSSLLPKVLMRGCADHPTMTDISYRLDDLYAADVYGRVYGRGETQFFGISASMLKDRFATDGTAIEDGVLDMIEALLLRPLLVDGAFRAEYVESEKAQLLQKISAQKNNKRRYAVKRCEELMCEGEAYGIPTYGYAEDIKAITPESLYAFYEKVIREMRCELYFVGEGDPALLSQKLKSRFGTLGNAGAPAYTCEVIRRAEKAREITEKMPMEQSKLSVGFRTGTVLPDGRWHVFSVFSEIFGASATSKLFANVREKLSLCYYCSSIAEAHKGIMIVYSGLSKENKEKALTEIMAQLDAVKAGDITDEELDMAKKGVINAYRALNDSPSSLEGWYTGRAMAGISTTPEDCIPMVEAVTKEDVQAVASLITADTVYFLEAEEEE
ncbi:MAG: insulinase family protein [Clostridia bacterium]|nr:insulinase family protein [Clostridia bacterium]